MNSKSTLLTLVVSFAAFSPLTSHVLALETTTTEVTIIDADGTERKIVTPTTTPPRPVIGPATNVTSKAQSPEEKRLQDLLKLKFDRNPPNVLQTLRQEMDGESPTNAVERFQRDVIAGRWQAVGEFLKQLPEKHAPQVYEHLIKQLQTPSGRTSVPTPVPDESGVIVTRATSSVPISTGLTPDDVLELVDIAPGEFSAKQIELLGPLLERVLAEGHLIDGVLNRLETGTRNLGGKDPKQRIAAAQFLVAAKREREAGRFLPPLDARDETSDPELIEMWSRHLIAIGRAGQKRDALRQAWDLNLRLLARQDATKPLQERTIERCLEILPLLPIATGDAWLRRTFVDTPRQGIALLTQVDSKVAKDRTSREPERRRENLEIQSRLLNALLATPARDNSAWEKPVALLTLNWLEEADYTRQRYVPDHRQGMMQQVDPFGNVVYYGEPPIYQSSGQKPAIPPEALLKIGPGDEWLTSLNVDLAARSRLQIAHLHFKAEEPLNALPILSALARTHRTDASRLANELLDAWARAKDPNKSIPTQRYGPFGTVYYGPGSPYGMRPQGMSLTRSMQVRNLNELSRLLDEVRRLPIDPLDDKTVARAFTTAHSQAEVFRVEDIEMVCGRMDRIKRETLAELLQTMRQRLATLWRQPRVQQQAGTKRSDKEIDAEILRGYEVLAGLVERGVARDPADWRLSLALASTLFDWAEFQYGRKVDLAIYVEKRDRAFGLFERASDLYAGELLVLEEKDHTAIVYQQWLNANLGASDLAYVTRQTDPNESNLDKIRTAIQSLPEDTRKRHLTAFAKALSDNINSIPAHLKPRYLRAGLRIVGDHPDAEPARKLVTYYDDLLNEIALDVRIDGDTTVGHGRPFGVFVALRYTTAVERESGGFTKYLRNLSQSGYYYNPYGTPPVDHRDEFEKQIREKLSEGFEVLGITFHDDKVTSRGYGRTGWREMPMTYLLLKAKDAATDRIPSMRLDLDFVDRNGQVVLPVESQVVLLDARPASLPPRPMDQAEVTHILDDRELKQGKLALEIKASAQGLLPELRELFDLSFAGFKIDQVQDHGLAVVRLHSEGDKLVPMSERSWQIQLSTDSAGSTPAVFRFLTPRREGVQSIFKRYDDADVVEVKPELALAGVPLRPTRVWVWATFGVGVLVVAGLVCLRIMRRRPAQVPLASAYAMPAHVNPFSVVTLLRQMQQDSSLPLSAERRIELGQAISQIESRFFSRGDGDGSMPELEAIASTWVTTTRPDFKRRD